MLLLDPTAPGVTLSRLPTMGRNITGVYEVFLDDVELPADSLVGVENEGWQQLSAELPLERLIISAGFIGATFQVLEDTLRHVKEREQFGRPLGNFQAVAHLLVDLFTRAESRHSSTASLQCAETATLADDCIRLPARTQRASASAT